MAAITYTADFRANLVTGHSVGTAYSIDVKLKAYSTALDAPKTVHVALNGSVETVLRRATRVITATISWPDTLNANVEEFLWSIAAGEIFQFDAYGSVATPDEPIDVVSVNKGFNMMPIQRIQATTRSITLTLRPAMNRQ